MAVVLSNGVSCFQEMFFFCNSVSCFQEMAVVSSATACAPITSHNTSLGSIANLATITHTTTSEGVAPFSSGTLPPGLGSGLFSGGSGAGASGGASSSIFGSGASGSLACRLQGLTEKFSSLGRSSDCDSTSSGRCRTGMRVTLFLHELPRDFAATNAALRHDVML